MRLDESGTERHYALVAEAIAFIRAHARGQPSLAAVAEAVHVSPHHLQRVFAEWAGISPKRFLQYLTKEHAKAQLRAARDTLAVCAEAGLSSGSRLHDLMVSCEAMTPGEIQAGGRGLCVGYGMGRSPFGMVLIAWTPRGICHLAFFNDAPDAMLAALRCSWPHAHFEENDAMAADWLARIFPQTPTRGSLHLLLRGTNFQIKVWEALLRIAPGEVRSYRQLAAEIGQPSAARAVGNALAANSLGYLIPCHRVLREGGEVGQYRWGSERKLAMLAWEAGQGDGQP